jgi:hypothetical protein
MEIVDVSRIQRFNRDKVSYTKKYNIKQENSDDTTKDSYFQGVIIIIDGKFQL